MEGQKFVNLVDLEKFYKMSIWLQKSASIQPRTSPIKFDHSAEKSEQDTVLYLSTKVARRLSRRARVGRDGLRAGR